MTTIIDYQHDVSQRNISYLQSTNPLTLSLEIFTELFEKYFNLSIMVTQLN